MTVIKDNRSSLLLMKEITNCVAYLEVFVIDDKTLMNMKYRILKQSNYCYNFSLFKIHGIMPKS